MGLEQKDERLIFVVDDDVDLRDAMVDLLQDRGFSVISAANGREALDALRVMSKSPAVILLDLMMPQMDGYTFLAKLRQEPSLAKTPVVVVTAGNGVDRARLGTTPIIPKPIKLPLLFSTLEALGVGASKPA